MFLSGGEAERRTSYKKSRVAEVTTEEIDREGFYQLYACVYNYDTTCHRQFTRGMIFLGLENSFLILIEAVISPCSNP